MLSFTAVPFPCAILATPLAMAAFSDGTTIEPVSLSIGPAPIGEVLVTFMHVWVIMNIATAKAYAGNQFYGIAIGFTVTGAIYTVGTVSLAVLNPAVAVSLVIIGKLDVTQI